MSARSRFALNVILEATIAKHVSDELSFENSTAPPALRIGHALSLPWDQWVDDIRVDISGKGVMLLILLEGEKGGQDRVYPVTPDFAELLRSVPPAERSGLVFKPILYRGVCHRIDMVSKAITRLGEAANP